MRHALALTMLLGCSGTAAPPAAPPEPPTPTTREDTPPAPAPAPAPVAEQPAPAEPSRPQPPPPEASGAPPAGRVTESDLAPATPVARHKTASQAEIAARVNEEGRRAAFAGKYDLASSKFREAVARVPEPGYFFNLCTSLFQEGKFSEALTACNAVENQNPPPALLAKARKLIARILDEAKRQRIDVHPASSD